MARKRYTAKQEQIPRFAPFLRQGRRDDSSEAGSSGTEGIPVTWQARSRSIIRGQMGNCGREVS
jgi:hypothetical protein